MYFSADKSRSHHEGLVSAPLSPRNLSRRSEMLPSQHVFSHQHQYPQAEPSWLHQSQSHQQQQQHSHPAAHQHTQAQTATAAQQQHYNRLAVSNNNNNNNNSNSNSGHGIHAEPNVIGGSNDGNWSEENRRVLGWVAELMNGNSRETALMELSKKREQVPELALIIWHSFGKAPGILHEWKVADCRQGVMASLLQEIISVYPLLNPSQLTAAASNRVCNALALLQCVASHNETRTLFLNGMYMATLTLEQRRVD